MEESILWTCEILSALRNQISILFSVVLFQTVFHYAKLYQFMSFINIKYSISSFYQDSLYRTHFGGLLYFLLIFAIFSICTICVFAQYINILSRPRVIHNIPIWMKRVHLLSTPELSLSLSLWFSLSHSLSISLSQSLSLSFFLSLFPSLFLGEMSEHICKIYVSGKITMSAILWTKGSHCNHVISPVVYMEASLTWLFQQVIDCPDKTRDSYFP